MSLHEKNSELERINKMRQDFVANVSHELRTPLTVIHGYIETLSSLHKHDAKLYNVFEKMAAQTQRMEILVEDLLLLSQIESKNPHAEYEVINILALIEAIKGDAENLSGEDHVLTFNVDSALQLRGETHELRSAFSNLIVNAIHYTPRGGKVSVSWQKHKDTAVFSVTDTGIGIEAKHIPRLTERFYRVDKSRSRQSGGTGLGLAITKHVLLRHDAKLIIDSEVGKGSVFKCVFPAARLA